MQLGITVSQQNNNDDNNNATVSVSINFFSGCSPLPCVSGYACAEDVDNTTLCTAPDDDNGAGGSGAGSGAANGNRDLSSSSDSSSPNILPIILGVLAGILFIILVLVILSRRRRKFDKRPPTPPASGTLVTTTTTTTHNVTPAKPSMVEGMVFNNPTFVEGTVMMRSQGAKLLTRANSSSSRKSGAYEVFHGQDEYEAAYSNLGERDRSAVYAEAGAANDYEAIGAGRKRDSTYEHGLDNNTEPHYEVAGASALLSKRWDNEYDEAKQEAAYDVAHVNGNKDPAYDVARRQNEDPAYDVARLDRRNSGAYDVAKVSKSLPYDAGSSSDDPTYDMAQALKILDGSDRNAKSSEYDLAAGGGGAPLYATASRQSDYDLASAKSSSSSPHRHSTLYNLASSDPAYEMGGEVETDENPYELAGASQLPDYNQGGAAGESPYELASARQNGTTAADYDMASSGAGAGKGRQYDSASKSAKGSDYDLASKGSDYDLASAAANNYQLASNGGDYQMASGNGAAAKFPRAQATVHERAGGRNMIKRKKKAAAVNKKQQHQQQQQDGLYDEANEEGDDIDPDYELAGSSMAESPYDLAANGANLTNESPYDLAAREAGADVVDASPYELAAATGGYDLAMNSNSSNSKNKSNSARPTYMLANSGADEVEAETDDAPYELAGAHSGNAAGTNDPDEDGDHEYAHASGNNPFSAESPYDMATMPKYDLAVQENPSGRKKVMIDFSADEPVYDMSDDV